MVCYDIASSGVIGFFCGTQKKPIFSKTSSTNDFSIIRSKSTKSRIHLWIERRALEFHQYSYP